MGVDKIEAKKEAAAVQKQPAKIAVKEKKTTIFPQKFQEPPKVKIEPGKLPEAPWAPEKEKTYTVQKGDSFTKLIKESLKGQGYYDITDEMVKKAKEEFKKNNVGIVKKSKNGVEYLLVGKKVKLVGLSDKNNGAEQEGQWSAEIAKGLKKTACKNIYCDKDGKHFKLDPKTGKFTEMKGVVEVNKFGSYRKETITKTGAKIEQGFNKNNQIVTESVKNAKGKYYIQPAFVAKQLGMRATYGTKADGIYYDPATKKHFKWDAKNSAFEVESGYDYIAKNGERFNHGKKIG
ncbi:MAG: hypothetical protein LKG27_01160 [Clostridiaceae bacterium]|jgi:hypothetical protein|nr:hypothetical protein [Clostridiaceae bacterium]